METKHSSAVLIHGLHVAANSWDSLVWGDISKGVWGNIPRGVEYAYRTNASMIYWGTGASEQDGKKEAEVMYERTLNGVEELAGICGTDKATMEAFLKERSFLDTESKDTNTEIRACYDLCLERGIKNVVLVPYASQAPLAVRRALWMATEDEKYSKFKHHVSVEPSDTRYAGMSMQDIVIFTPPHRGDRVVNPSHVLARKTLDVIQRLSKAGDKEGVNNFLNEWKLLLDKWLS